MNDEGQIRGNTGFYVMGNRYYVKSGVRVRSEWGLGRFRGTVGNGNEEFKGCIGLLGKGVFPADGQKEKGSEGCQYYSMLVIGFKMDDEGQISGNAGFYVIGSRYYVKSGTRGPSEWTSLRFRRTVGKWR
ncbi:hypothetical protein C8R45DRAFT_941724 [Mycena sanguinolenta]|nr:hypothetical protein C8R45DRAFT_941724 [Mycena sanguinolenta]